MTSLGSRLLQGEQTFAQTAEAMNVRAKGEESVIDQIAQAGRTVLSTPFTWWVPSTLNQQPSTSEVAERGD